MMNDDMRSKYERDKNIFEYSYKVIHFWDSMFQFGKSMGHFMRVMKIGLL